MGTRRNSLLPASIRVTRNDPARKPTWVLLLQRTKARILEYRGSRKALVDLFGFVNPAGGMPGRRLVSDRAGRTQGGGGNVGRHGMGKSEEAQEHALNVFVKELARTVERGIAEGRCERLILAAEPHCLGKIKSTLHGTALKHIRAEVPKDLFQLDNRALVERLENALRQNVR